jgi:PIN domain nuclease of toxin-antitoxin system
MDLLLDTHVLIWWVLKDPKLGKRTRKEILREGAHSFISAVSVWEIGIKSAAGRLELRDSPENWMPRLLAKGFEPLPITIQHAIMAGPLPPHHRDPFDRMLIAQAQCEDLTLVTADPLIFTYDVRTLDASQ